MFFPFKLNSQNRNHKKNPTVTVQVRKSESLFCFLSLPLNLRVSLILNCTLSAEKTGMIDL